ncbi:MAG: hypothetical protein EOO75_04505, partial [Myxococcales bacterium]
GWEGSFLTDPALLDGGLQLARLWGLRTLGRPSLPTRIGALVVHVPGLAAGSLRCLLRSRAPSEHRTVSDLSFVDPAGRLVAELRDVEMHMLAPSEPATTTSNV